MTRGDRVKRLRIRLGLTQEKVAELAGYGNKSAISKIESAGDNVTYKTAERIASVFNCEPAYIMGWSGDTPTISEREEPRHQIASPALVEYVKTEDNVKGSEERMLLYLYGLLSKENKSNLVGILQDMLTRQKGGKNDD